MTSAYAEVQAAFYQRLAADPSLGGLVSGVYDDLDETVQPPYLVIGEATEVPEHAHDRQGLRATVTLHVWSTYSGYAQTQQVIKAIDRLLDRRPLTVPGFTDVSCACEFSQEMRDPDPAWRHGVIRYRLWLTEQEA